MTEKQLAQRKAARAAWGRKYHGSEQHKQWTKAGWRAAMNKIGYGRLGSLIDGPNYAGERFSKEITKREEIPF